MAANCSATATDPLLFVPLNSGREFACLDRGVIDRVADACRDGVRLRGTTGEDG